MYTNNRYALSQLNPYGKNLSKFSDFGFAIKDFIKTFKSLDFLISAFLRRLDKVLVQKLGMQKNYEGFQIKLYLDSSLEPHLLLKSSRKRWKVFNTKKPIFFDIYLVAGLIQSNAVTDLKELPEAVKDKLEKTLWDFIYNNLDSWAAKVQEEAKNFKNEIARIEFKE